MWIYILLSVSQTKCADILYPCDRLRTSAARYVADLHVTTLQVSKALPKHNHTSPHVPACRKHRLNTYKSDDVRSTTPSTKSTQENQPVNVRYSSKSMT